MGTLATPVALAKGSDSLSLTVVGPPGCVDETRLRVRVDTLLGVNFETDTALRAEVRVQELGPADFQLVLSYATESGAQDVRRLRGESCEAVAEAAALLLTMTLNPRATLAAEQEKPEQPVEKTVPPAAVEPAAPPTAGADWSIAPTAGALVLIDSIFLPRPTGGASVLFGLAIGPFELRLRGQLFLPVEVDLSGTLTRFNAWSVELSVCHHWRVSAVSVGPCVRAEVGQIIGSTRGENRDPTSADARPEALGAGGELRVRLAGPVSLALNIDFTWIIRSPTFEVDRLGPVGERSRFGLRASFGPLLTW